LRGAALNGKLAERALMDVGRTEKVDCRGIRAPRDSIRTGPVVYRGG